MSCRREKAGLPVDDEQEYLPLSWLSQADYCLRRAALLLNERVWVENVETAKGRAEHERVHTQRVERRGDFVKLYENSVFSDKLQISGKCDCIEAIRDKAGCMIPAVDFPVRLLPVEYKHGKLRDESEYKIQLCAQAMCLEEMYHTIIPTGALFFITAHRRWRWGLMKRCENKCAKLCRSSGRFAMKCEFRRQSMAPNANAAQCRSTACQR